MPYHGYYYGIDMYYIVLVLPCVLFAFWAQNKVNSTFNRYSRVQNLRGLTGAQAAQRILQANGITDVRIEHISGKLTDHFDPQAKVIRLSDEVYGVASIAAVGVAAHEAGHAVQYATDYAPIRIRAAIIPATRIGSNLSWPLLIAGLIFNWTALVWAGILLFGLVTVFQLATLPVEFNASRRALAAIESGVDKIRLNPGNIGGADRVQAVVKAAKARHLPIRIGVNSGSVEKHILEKFGGPTPEAMVESALYHVGLLNDCDFDDICISIKSSSVPNTMQAYLLASEKTDYPLHLGVTEAGTEYMGTIKSAAGIGGLLALGVGDTIRVSLTDDPVKEVYAAKAILRAVGRAEEGINVVSCPTCGRTRIDLIGIAKEVERRCAEIHGRKLKVAVMGCVVNGPGEAREADLGIAGGDGEGLIFRRGEILRKVPQERLVDELMDEIAHFEGE